VVNIRWRKINRDDKKRYPRIPGHKEAGGHDGLAFCQICWKEFWERDLCQDHHHASGQLRGGLCRSCNLLIGFAREDEEILLSAVEYLAFWRKKRVGKF